MKNNKLSRRRMLTALGVGTGAFVMRDLAATPSAHAEEVSLLDQPLLVLAYFGGGWDTLATLDPRNHQSFGAPGGAVCTGYDLLAQNDPIVAQVMADSGNTGLIQPSGSNIAFGPAMGKLADRFADLCVIRGVDMGTLAHEVGRRYFLTGKFPRGLRASGSAMPTALVANHPEAAVIPNLVVGGVETYNEGLDPRASGLSVREHQSLALVLKSVDEGLTLETAVRDAIDAHHAGDVCLHRQLDAGYGLVDAWRASMATAGVLMGGNLWQHFDFQPNPGGVLETLYNSFDVDVANPGDDIAGVKGQGLIAAQALTQNICQAVSIQPAGNLDAHDGDEWQQDHGPALRAGFDVIANLIDYLKATPDPNGKPYFDRTTIVCFSEFARTPDINVRGGRDHHLASACLLAGAGIKGNQSIGATTDNLYAVTPIDLESGVSDESGHIVRPADVHATVFQAMGLSYDHISNQSPVLINAALK